MKKVIVSDYDQTFYINDQDIEKNKIAIDKFRNGGNIFIVATGRSYWDLKKKVDIYDIKCDYAILNHGTTIIDETGKIISNISIKNEVIPKIKDEIKLKEATNYFCCSGLESRVDFTHKDLTKINVKYKTQERAIEINNILNKNYKEYVNSYYIMNTSIEIIPSRTDKSKAIEKIIDKLGIDKANVYSIGDGYSDIEMVQNYNGFCMKGSVKELRKVAKKEYASVSDLVAEIINNKL